tara:strand:+ start:44 stop:238 length:195 start_codon:yes stop_codon:yes gene_type:complete
MVTTASILLEELQTLESRKANAITTLLAERKDLAASTKLRMEQIEVDLKALGYKRQRKAKSAKA